MNPSEQLLRQIVERLARLEKEVFAEEILDRRLARLSDRMARHQTLLPALITRWISEIAAIRKDEPEPQWADYPARGDDAELNNRAVYLERFLSKIETAIGENRLMGAAMPEISNELASLRKQLEDPVNPVERPGGIIEDFVR